MEEVIKVEDKSRIDKVTFLYPDLMHENAEEVVKERYSRLMSIEKSLQEARCTTRSLEEEYKKAQAEWNQIKVAFTYTHPTTEKKVIKNTCEMIIKGHGNDIIGKTTVM